MITRDQLKKEQSWFYKAGYEMGFRDGLVNRKDCNLIVPEKQDEDAKRTSNSTDE